MYYKFTPILKNTIWGGTKIAPFKNIQTQLRKVGESWEISGVPGNETIVSGGPYAGRNLNDLVAEQKEALVGKANYERFGNEFPLLIKFIDARDDLSIQVHPTDEIAHRQGRERGKTEMWYLMPSEPEATLLCGLKKHITPDEYKRMVSEKTIVDAIARYPVHEGDCFFLPAGRIHAIGSGCFLAEIQQSLRRCLSEGLFNPRIAFLLQIEGENITVEKQAVPFRGLIADVLLLAEPVDNRTVDPFPVDFVFLLAAQPLWKSMGNSFLYAITQTLLCLFICSLAGFGSELYADKAKDRLFAFLLLAMMIPGVATMIPLFTMISKMGMLNSVWGFILPQIATPFMIMMFRNNSRNFPPAIMEAARIDGQSEAGIFFRQYLPIMRSTYAAAAVITFMNAWNAYLWPKVVMTDNKAQTMPMLIANLAAGYTIDYGVLMMGVLFCSIPTMVVFFVLQKQFAEGITGSVK
jgi:lactose/L-arabinose transport system permease protein